MTLYVDLILQFASFQVQSCETPFFEQDWFSLCNCVAQHECTCLTFAKAAASSILIVACMTHANLGKRKLVIFISSTLCGFAGCGCSPQDGIPHAGIIFASRGQNRICTKPPFEHPKQLLPNRKMPRALVIIDMSACACQSRILLLLQLSSTFPTCPICRGQLGSLRIRAQRPVHPELPAISHGASAHRP